MAYTDLDHPAMQGGHQLASGKWQYEPNEPGPRASQDMTRAIVPDDGSEILLEAHQLINGDRNKTYGHPIHDYTKTTELFFAMTGIRLTPEAAILFMMCVKISRLTNNMAEGKYHRDSAVDIGGYLGCLAKVQTFRNQAGERFSI